MNASHTDRFDIPVLDALVEAAASFVRSGVSYTGAAIGETLHYAAAGMEGVTGVLADATTLSVGSSAIASEPDFGAILASCGSSDLNLGIGTQQAACAANNADTGQLSVPTFVVGAPEERGSALIAA